jgi:hypothetical protein
MFGVSVTAQEAGMATTLLLDRTLRRIRAVSVHAVVLSVLATSACSTMRVQTLPSPQANLVNRRTFRIVDAPVRRDVREVVALEGVLPAWSAEPMLNNSITNQVIGSEIRRAFEARGYVYNEKNADFNVVFVANARERIEVNNTGYYGYYGYGFCCNVYEYTEGTVIIDVVDPANKMLMWRGSAVADVSDNPEKYIKEQRKAVRKIVGRFPTVGTPVTVVKGTFPGY